MSSKPLISSADFRILDAVPGSLSELSAEVDRIASSHVRWVFAENERQIASVFEEALMTCAIRGEVGVVLVFDRSAPSRMRARLI